MPRPNIHEQGIVIPPKEKIFLPLGQREPSVPVLVSTVPLADKPRDPQGIGRPSVLLLEKPSHEPVAIVVPKIQISEREQAQPQPAAFPARSDRAVQATEGPGTAEQAIPLAFLDASAPPDSPDLIYGSPEREVTETPIKQLGSYIPSSPDVVFLSPDEVPLERELSEGVPVRLGTDGRSAQGRGETQKVQVIKQESADEPQQLDDGQQTPRPHAADRQGRGAKQPSPPAAHGDEPGEPQPELKPGGAGTTPPPENPPPAADDEGENRDPIVKVVEKIQERIQERERVTREGSTPRESDAKIVAQVLRESIDSEELPRGKALPGTKSFAEMIDVPPSTVEAARTTLAEEGYLRSVPSVGTVVATPEGEIPSDTVVVREPRRLYSVQNTIRQIPAGGIIPSDYELSEQLEVSEMTVRRAIEPLRAEGEVIYVPGLTRFRPSNTEDPKELRLERLLQLPSERGRVLRLIQQNYNTPGLLPSFTELADELGVSSREAQRALEDLRKVGFATGKRGERTRLHRSLPEPITQPPEDEGNEMFRRLMNLGKDSHPPKSPENPDENPGVSGSSREPSGTPRDGDSLSNPSTPAESEAGEQTTDEHGETQTSRTHSEESEAELPNKEEYLAQFKELELGETMLLPMNLIRPLDNEDNTPSHHTEEPIEVYGRQLRDDLRGTVIPFIFIADGNHRYYDRQRKETKKAERERKQYDPSTILIEVRKVIPSFDDDVRIRFPGRGWEEF